MPSTPNVITEQDLYTLFSKSADVKIEKLQCQDASALHHLLLIYCEGMADSSQLYQHAFPILEEIAKNGDFHPEQTSSSTLQFHSIDLHNRIESIIASVYSGQLIVYFNKTKLVYSLNISNPPHREPNESSTEISIKGPKDGFTEELATNVALVRKRLRTNSLCYEQFILGERTRTKVALLYIDDIIRKEFVEEARTRINRVRMDAVFSSAQLEEVLADSSNSLFPLLDYSGRPDYIANCLLHGRLAIIADGAPAAVIAPTNFTLILKSPEDSYFPYYFVILERFFRLIGLVLALFLPGFWVSLVSFHMDQLPFPLMATVTLSRIGLPLTAPMEAFLMLGLFELFREAGVRLPKAVGQTVAVVGGLIIGDSAIRAGLASTTMLVVASITAVATFTLVNQSLSGSVTVIRLYVLLCSSILGMFGFFLSLFSIVLYLSNLKSFGMPYLAPLSPFNLKDFIAGLFIKPIHKTDYRPEILNTLDSKRRGGNNS